MSQAKNIDQADKINQTIGIIVLSRAATVKVEKPRTDETKWRGSEKDETTLEKLRSAFSAMAEDV